MNNTRKERLDEKIDFSIFEVRLREKKRSSLAYVYICLFVQHLCWLSVCLIVVVVGSVSNVSPTKTMGGNNYIFCALTLVLFCPRKVHLDQARWMPVKFDASSTSERKKDAPANASLSGVSLYHYFLHKRCRDSSLLDWICEWPVVECSLSGRYKRASSVILF